MQIWFLAEMGDKKKGKTSPPAPKKQETEQKVPLRQ